MSYSLETEKTEVYSFILYTPGIVECIMPFCFLRGHYRGLSPKAGNRSETDE